LTNYTRNEVEGCPLLYDRGEDGAKLQLTLLKLPKKIVIHIGFDGINQGGQKFPK